MEHDIADDGSGGREMASNDCSVCVSWGSSILMYTSNVRSLGCKNICGVVILYDEHILWGGLT